VIIKSPQSIGDVVRALWEVKDVAKTNRCKNFCGNPSVISLHTSTEPLLLA